MPILVPILCTVACSHPLPSFFNLFHILSPSLSFKSPCPALLEDLPRLRALAIARSALRGLREVPELGLVRSAAVFRLPVVSGLEDIT